jgi:hypothetical protein
MMNRLLLALLLPVMPLCAGEGQEGKLRAGIDASCVLFLGNSMTRHVRAPKFGWICDWDMAASARDKDNVHLVAAGLAAADGEAVRRLAAIKQ